MKALACVWCFGLAGLAHAAPDMDGSVDPPGFERFPASWIVGYAAPTTVRGYEFVTGRVDRSGRQRRLDDSTRLPMAELVRVTYRAPDNAGLDEVIEHYVALLDGRGADVAFTCRARDCGRSTTWANDVFGVKELVAPDSSQFYMAASLGDIRASIYVVQRGNRRVYAHVDVARVQQAAQGGVAANLRGRGFAVLEDAAPRADGTFDAAALAALDAIGAELADAGGQSLFVVCHLAAADDPMAAVTRSTACAAAAAERLTAVGLDAQSFGAGPFVPRPNAPPDRLELVIPKRR